MTSHHTDIGTILITGTSSGLGRATALLLDKAGYRVFATVRREQDAERLRNDASSRLTPLFLDISEPEQIDVATATVRTQLGPARGLSGLVNNAGICEAGPLETIRIDRLRRQFEINVIQHLAVTQAFLPMIRQCRGRIINISSAVADCPMPILGAYAASKSAMTSLSITLRRELYWFGIRVCCIEPGFMDAAIWGEADTLLETIRQEDHAGLYASLVDLFYGMITPAQRLAASPDLIAQAVKRALEARRPKAVYRVGPGSSTARFGNHLPEGLVHWFLKKSLKKKGALVL